jgi:hypothetical protein
MDARDGYTIYYFDISPEFKIAWTEYKGALFISDIDTLREIGNYYDPADKYESLPSEYCVYFHWSIDNCIEKFYKPYKPMIEAAWPMVKDELTDDKQPFADFVEEALPILAENDNFGAFEVWSYHTSDGEVSSVEFSETAGPIILGAMKANQARQAIILEKIMSGDIKSLLPGH